MEGTDVIRHRVMSIGCLAVDFVAVAESSVLPGIFIISWKIADEWQGVVQTNNTFVTKRDAVY